MSWNCEHRGLQWSESSSGEAAGPHPAPSQQLLQGQCGRKPVLCEHVPCPSPPHPRNPPPSHSQKTPDSDPGQCRAWALICSEASGPGSLCLLYSPIFTPVHTLRHRAPAPPYDRTLYAAHAGAGAKSFCGPQSHSSLAECLVSCS